MPLTERERKRGNISPTDESKNVHICGMIKCLKSRLGIWSWQSSYRSKFFKKGSTYVAYIKVMRWFYWKKQLSAQPHKILDEYYWWALGSPSNTTGSAQPISWHRTFDQFILNISYFRVLACHIEQFGGWQLTLSLWAWHPCGKAI